jgi:transcriptional regulator with XRE-family HTH domain
MDIRTYRRMWGLTQKEFAKLVGCSLPAMANYENGRRVPTLRYSKRIHEVTKGKVTIEDLLKTREDTLKGVKPNGNT